jgi:hypothetical protein
LADSAGVALVLAALGAAEGALLGAGVAEGAAELSPDGIGPGLPLASPSCARTCAGTLTAVALSARHHTSDQTEAPRALQVWLKPNAASDSEQCSWLP